MIIDLSLIAHGKPLHILSKTRDSRGKISSGSIVFHSGWQGHHDAVRLSRHPNLYMIRFEFVESIICIILTILAE